MKIFRNKIISSGEHHHKKMIKIQDFYNMSNFRDLLFHTQETHFTILEIKEHLSNLGLKFCGFEDTKNNNKFETKFKIFDDRYDLKKWHKFEVDNPNIFLNMYQFWCQKIN